jgi:hypothetical protein
MTHFDWPGFLESDIPLRSKTELGIAMLHLKMGTPFSVARQTGFFHLSYDYWQVRWLTHDAEHNWTARVQKIKVGASS